MAAQRKGMLPWQVVTIFLLTCSFTGAVGDVPDGVVYTDLHTTVLKGNTTILKCEFFGDPIAVYWTKGDDPDQGTSLISWVEGSNPSGSCVTDNTCDMGDDYSLIIRDARISDQGRYICQVSNYLGILIHNYTDVKIYAPPTKPFPVIDECVESGSSTFNSRQPCSVLSNGSIVISCTVLNYYPDLDLFFLHGSQKIMDAEINEATNTDGTKNKTISIKVSPSETPYVCVASDIPGSNDQRASTILVKSFRPTESTITAPHRSPTSSTTKGGKLDSPNDKAAKIAVPIVVIMVIAGIGIVLFFAIRRWKAHKPSSLGCDSVNKDPEEQVELLEKAKIDGRDSATIIDIEEQVKANIDGDISFYELWSLAYETPENDKMRIHQVLTKLNSKDVTEGLSSGNIYDLLCKWKEEKQTDDLAELLREALASADLKIRWLQLCEQRQRADSKVSQETLKQIILEIGNPDKIQQFLGELIPNRPIKMDGKGEGKGFIEEATEVMREWSKGPFEENPFASLSLALERSGCSPLDRTFFGGMISFFELWSLSHYLKDYDTDEKYSVFEELGLVVEDRLTREELYDLLCSWKNSSKTISQGKRLRDALDKANLRKRWKDMKDLRRGDNTQVSQHTLEHILWHIKDPKKIDQFTQRLTLDHPGTQLDVTRGLRDIIKEAVTRLQIWAKKRFDENPLVLLSLALEKTGCSPIDRTFFKASHALTQDIEDIKIQSFVDSLTDRHIKTLAECWNIGLAEDSINRENKETIFNTEPMISDWIAQQECSNYEKRWKLNKAVDCVGRQDLKDFFGEMEPAIHVGIDYETSIAHAKDTVQGGKIDNQTSDFIKEEYQRIATYLSPPQIKDLFGHGGKSDDPRGTVQSYAEKQMAKKSKKDVREKLREKLKSIGLQDLIPSELEHSVYLCELLDVAFRLILEDVYPFAKALGISDEKLKDYRVNYVPHHLTKGTTAILIKLSEANNNDRRKVCEALSHAGYTNIARLLEYGHETSLADEFAIASAASNKGDKGKLLDKISEKLGISHISITEGALRDWRSMVHPPAYNHRTSLADAVCSALGADVAISILSGQYRENGSESSSVIQAIASGIESLDLHLIAKILDVKNAGNLGALTVSSQNTDFTEPSSTVIEGGSTRTEASTGTRLRSATALKLADILSVNVSRQMFVQATAILQVLETWEEGLRKNPLKKGRRDLSDNLLRAGFKEFASEIMTGFVPRPKSKDKNRKKDGQEYRTKVDQGKKGGRGNQVMQHDMQGEQDKKSTVGEQNKRGKSKGLDTINDSGNVENAGLENKNDNKSMIAEGQPRLDNAQQAKKTATSNVQGIMTSKYNKQQFTGGNDGKQGCEDRIKEQLDSGNDRQERSESDGQQPNGSDRQQPNGSDRQQPNGSDGQQPNGSDGQHPNESGGQKPSESAGQYPSGSEGDNLAEATGNNQTESTVNNPSETTVTSSGNDNQSNEEQSKQDVNV